MISASADNDILTKGVIYGLFVPFCDALDIELKNVVVLETARFVAGRRIKHAAPADLVDASVGELASVLSKCQVMNPSPTELDLAATLELAAQRLGLALDIGESQLCAVAVKRKIDLLLTGDKRAIAAMQTLILHHGELEHLKGRVRCLEQLVVAVLRIRALEVVRAAVCRAPTLDKALAFSFSCHAELTTLDLVVEGLDSYIAAIDGQELIATSRSS